VSILETHEGLVTERFWIFLTVKSANTNGGHHRKGDCCPVGAVVPGIGSGQCIVDGLLDEVDNNSVSLNSSGNWKIGSGESSRLS